MPERLRLRESQVEWREVEGQVMALDLRSSRYLLVNQTGCVLWEALREGTTHSGLVDCLRRTHSVDRERAAGDVNAFLGELDSRDLLIRESLPERSE